MTFNIRHGAGIRGRVDLRRTARVIRDARVDVAALQEVDRHFAARSGYLDQVAWLAGELDMHVVFGPALDEDPAAPGDPRRQYGNVILSAEPIVDWDNTLLPRSAGHERRGLLRARVDARGVTWQVYATQLQNNDAGQRLAQARRVAEVIGAPTHPVVLLADLNAVPDSPEVRVLTGNLLDTADRAGATFYTPLPRRIDYILRSRPVRASNARVIRSLRAWTASDHRPVVADLAVAGTDRRDDRRLVR